MTIKEEIINFMIDKPQATLEEIYPNIESKHSVVRGIINTEIKKGQTFERISRKTYKLKEITESIPEVKRTIIKSDKVCTDC